MFNSKGNNTSHVDNRLNKCRQSFYSLNSLGMSYPGAARAAPEVQAHLYKSICQPVLTYGMECMSNSKDQFRRMESIQGLGLSKRSHNSAVLKALNIDKAQHIVNRNVLNLYHRIFKIDSPARSLMQFLLARYTCILHMALQFLEPYHRPLSRRLDRCDRVIQDEVGDSNGGNV